MVNEIVKQILPVKCRVTVGAPISVLLVKAHRLTTQ